MTATAAMAVTLLTAIAHADPTAGQKCEAGKNVAAAKYAVCLHKAQSKFVSNGETDTAGRDAAVLKCGIKYRNKWSRWKTRLQASVPARETNRTSKISSTRASRARRSRCMERRLRT